MKSTFFGFSVLLFIGCNYNHVKLAPEDDASFSAENFETPDFKTVQSRVIDPKCVSCHSNAGGNKGNTNLEDYSHVRALLARIAYRTLEVRDMPPGGLSGSSLRLFQNWIDSGSPETVVVTGEKPDPSLGKGPNNWAKVSTKIFARKCNDCHGAVAPDAGLDLTDLKQVREKILVIVDRVKVKRDMPIAPYPAITPKEQSIISQWIDSGMPE